MNNVVQRTITGSVYTALIVLSLVFHPIAFGVVTLLFNLLGLLEFKKIGDKLSINPGFLWIVINNLLFLVALTLIFLNIPGSSLIPLLLLLVVLQIFPIYQKSGNPFSSMQFSLFGSLYISLPLIILNLIQQHAINERIPYTLALFVIIWTNDTFAYLSGMAFGKHRLFERLSPKKSWEGFFGGAIMSVVAALIFNFFFPAKGTMYWILFAVLSCVASVFGDFVESLIKRNAGIKDSGTLLPGHGGILDRTDSLLLASPIIFIYLSLTNLL